MRYLNVLAIVGLLVLPVGCAGPMMLVQGDPSVQQEVNRLLARLNISFDQPEDEAIVRNGLYDFSYYLRERYGRPDWQKFLEGIQSGQTPEQAAIAVYGKTFYHLGAEMLAGTLSNPRQAPSPAKPVVHGLFRIECDDQAVLDRDLPYITYLLDKFEKEILDALDQNEESKARLRASVASLDQQKIGIYLLTRQDSVARAFKSPWSTAEAGIGFSIPSPGADVVMHANITFKYSSVLALNVVVHEMTHILHILSRFEADRLKTIPGGENPAELKKHLQAMADEIGAMSGGTVLGEGLAEVMAGKYNLLQRYGLMDDVDKTLGGYLQKNHINIQTLDMDQVIRSRNNEQRVLAYQMAHSWVRFLIGRYGMPKVLALMDTPGQSEDYKRILGQDDVMLLGEWQSELISGKPNITAKPNYDLYPWNYGF